MELEHTKVNLIPGRGRHLSTVSVMRNPPPLALKPERHCYTAANCIYLFTVRLFSLAMHFITYAVKRFCTYKTRTTTDRQSSELNSVWYRKVRVHDVCKKKGRKKSDKWKSHWEVCMGRCFLMPLPCFCGAINSGSSIF